MRRQRNRQNVAKKLLSSSSPAYKSMCSLSKVVKKAQSALSNPPCKGAIVKKLSFQFSAGAIDSKPKARPTALPEETK